MAAKAVGGFVEKILVVGDAQIDETLIAVGNQLDDMGTEKVSKQMQKLVEEQIDSVKAFIENIDTINELYNNPMQVLVDKDNLYIATVA